jgi:hypothetical protein
LELPPHPLSEQIEHRQVTTMSVRGSLIANLGITNLAIVMSRSGELT